MWSGKRMMKQAEGRARASPQSTPTWVPQNRKPISRCEIFLLTRTHTCGPDADGAIVWGHYSRGDIFLAAAVRESIMKDVCRITGCKGARGWG